MVLFYCVVEPIFDSAKTQQIVHFVTLERRLYQRLSPEQIGHLAGTAELRLVSGYSPEVWSSAASALGKGGQPDAVLTLPPHRVAVEFDTGSYPGKVVQKKLAVFSQEYDGLIWGVTGKVRYQRFVERYQALGVKVIQARWW
ncbi:hypothetical protein [Deinococcus xinjiangensis]|uniref:hypothetical protein n=1 Tax=Deinococcus xinjiangensis TaxID=457454 RepID=UPI0033654E73